MRSQIDPQFLQTAAHLVPATAQGFRHNPDLRAALDLYAAAHAEMTRLNGQVAALPDDAAEDHPTLQAFHCADLLHLQAGALLEATIDSQIHAEGCRVLLASLGVFDTRTGEDDHALD